MAVTVPAQALSDVVVRGLLSRLKAELEVLYASRLQAVWLYGSYARGEARAGSDLDVAAVLDDFDRPWPEIDRTGPLVSRLSLEYGITVSLIPVRKRAWEGKRSILARSLYRDGVPLP
jgi:predicted nucleotidyltransferase